MLKVRTATANGTLERGHSVAERRPAVRSGARREDPQVLDGLERKRRRTAVDAASHRTKLRYREVKPVQRREVGEIIMFWILIRLALSVGVLTLSACSLRVNDPKGPPPYVYSTVPGGGH